MILSLTSVSQRLSLLAGTISNTTQLALSENFFFSFTDDNRRRRELGLGKFSSAVRPNSQ
jgi:hypothetical protein